MLAAKTGVGYLIYEGVSDQNTARTVVGMICMGLMWLFIDNVYLSRSSGRRSSAGASSSCPKSGAEGHVPRGARRWSSLAVAAIPFLAVVAGWLVAPHVLEYPRYLLPPVGDVWTRLLQMLRDGSLARHTGGSLLRLAAGFVDRQRPRHPAGHRDRASPGRGRDPAPVLTFLQSIAGIAWIPLAIVWFGIGNGAVVFVIANIVFFSVIYNTVIGVQTIPLVLRRAVLASGGRGTQILTELLLPGALVQIILGLRTSVALGWRALVASEMLAGASGLGYLTIEAVQWYKTDVVLLGMIVIGLLWLLLDRLLFVPLERAHRRTVGHAPAVDHESVPDTSRKPSASGLSWEAPAWLDSIPRGWACALRLGSPMRSPCRR